MVGGIPDSDKFRSFDSEGKWKRDDSVKPVGGSSRKKKKFSPYASLCPSFIVRFGIF